MRDERRLLESREASMNIISDAEVEKRIKAWADVTMLSLEMKRAMLKKRYPEYSDDEIRHLMVKELSDAQDSDTGLWGHENA